MDRESLGCRLTRIQARSIVRGMTKGSRLLKLWRAEVKLSQHDVAQRLGIRESIVSHFECGRRTPNLDLLMAIEDMTGGSVVARMWTEDA